MERSQRQVARLREAVSNPDQCHARASRFLTQIGRTQADVRRYLSRQPARSSY